MLTRKLTFWHLVVFLMAVPIAALLFAGPDGIDGRALVSAVVLAAVVTVVTALLFPRSRR